MPRLGGVYRIWGTEVPGVDTGCRGCMGRVGYPGHWDAWNALGAWNAWSMGLRVLWGALGTWGTGCLQCRGAVRPV